MTPFYRNVIVAIVASALSTRAYALNSTSAFVNVQYGVTGGAGSVPNTSVGTVDNESQFSNVSLPDQNLSATWAETDFSNISAISSIPNRVLGVGADSTSKATYPSTGLLPGEGEAASSDIHAMAYIQDNMTFIPNDKSLLGQQFIIPTGWQLFGNFTASSDPGTVPNPGYYLPYGITDGGTVDLDISGTGMPPLGYSVVYADNYNSMYGTHTINGSNPIDSSNNQLDVVITGTWGVTIAAQYQMQLEVSSQAFTNDIYNQQNAMGSAFGHFLDTLSWDGISTITDTNGNPITSGWTVTSDSGTDWSLPGVDTPEPASLAFLSAAALATIKRRPSRKAG